MLEGDLKDIPELNFKIKEPYEHLVESTLKQMRLEVKKIKEEFKNIKGKVEGPELVNVEFMKYEYFIRGYHGVHRIFTYHFRNTAEKMLEGYFINKEDSYEFTSTI